MMGSEDDMPIAPELVPILVQFPVVTLVFVAA